MSISKITGLLLSSAAMVAGHGYVSGAVVDGTYHGGYLVNSYTYMPEVPENIGWAEKATDLGFVDGSSYDSPDIICHKEATPGAISAEVKAGGKVELQWTEWPESHHGPVITYMANCNGDCSKADKATLKFFKIAEAGLIDGSNAPGKWATDELIANNNSATVTIPSAIAAGNYVLRHEIIGLHSAGETNGAQNYPQCLNLKVTGGGKDAPEGVLGTALYKAADPGIKVSIYTAMDDYKIPGPALYTGAASGSSSGSSSGSETTAPATTAAPTAASTVSASPIQSSSSRHLTRTRTARPTSSPSGTPTPSSVPTSAASTSTSSEPGSESVEAPSTATETATSIASSAPSTATETATSIASSAPQVTDEPDTQTASAPADSVSITSTASAQSAQSTTPVSDGDDSESSGSTTSTAGAAASSGASSGSGSGDYSSYLSSLSAEKLLEAIRSTLKWLVSDSKVHARALAH